MVNRFYIFIITPLLILIFSSAVFSETLYIAAASDLALAFKEIEKIYEQKTGHKASYTFGSSGILARQIKHGAPFDLFASADIKYIKDLTAQGMVADDKYYVFGRGRLVIAVDKKKGAPSDLKDLERDGFKKIAIANPEHAPYGLAAKEAMVKAGIFDAVKAKLVFAENVRQAIQYIQTGNADAGIVALSLINGNGYDYLLIDEKLHAPIDQTIAALKDSKRKKPAEDFIAILLGDAGNKILMKYGFKRAL